MQKYLAVLVFFFVASLVNAQTGRISGTINDSKTGETLPGASVMIEGTTKGAAADFDGKFAINNVPAGKVTLVVSYVSYTSKKIEGVIVKANDVTNVNLLLEPSTSSDLQEVEVVVTLNKENNTALVLQQKNNSSISDGISAETIKRTPDRTTSDVLKRISGVTIQDDKFVIVRGLNERYNSSYLNGAALPSTEPDKKAFAFDLFPSNMLDNILVNKTATPDMPSEFAGGIVQINTKSIPEKNFVFVSAGAGFNSVTTGKNKTLYNGGKYDAFGFDDGSRNLPSQVPAYADKSTWIANNDQARVATYFKNDWDSRQGKFAPNTNLQFATGYNIKRKEKDFIGIIFSLANNSTQTLYNWNRTEYEGLDVPIKPTSVVKTEQQTNNVVNQTQTSTGGLLNLACKINDNNSISIKNLVTGSADNKFISALASTPIQAPGLVYKIDSRFFTANQVFSSQLNGEHFIPAAKIKVAWNASISRIERSVPDLRFNSYTKNQSITDPTNPNPLDTVYTANLPSGNTSGPDYAGYRVYSKLTENIKSSRLDLSKLFKVSSTFKINAKIGGLYQARERQYNIRQFGMLKYSPPGHPFDNSLATLPEDQIFATQNMSLTPDGQGGFMIKEITKETDNYNGQSKLRAGYAMAELLFGEKLKIIGGARYESYYQQITIQYPKVDSFFVKSTVNDLLPSLNVIYNLNEKLGLRLSYYKTLNRAEFRELTLTNWFDPETRLSVAGNPDLKRCYIQNGDARFEIYPGRGQLFTVTGFYKYFNSPIERFMNGGSENQIYYRNANFAKVYGGELEYRVNVGAILKTDSSRFLNNLNLFSNLSLIKSTVNVAGINSAVPDTRTMQGQAPYVINAGISYVDNKDNYSLTAMVNRVGQRIYIVGNEIVANRWENARTVLDLQATKSFFKNRLEIRFNLKDLFHKDYIIYYKGNNRKGNAYDSKVDFVNFKRNYGSTYSFLISYKF